MPDPSAATLLSVEGLRTHFFTNDGTVKAVDGVNFALKERETMGLVGESGSGKSITALTVMRLLSRPGRAVAGRVMFQGRNLLEISEEEMEDVRGTDIAMIYQEPMTSLNPVYRVGEQIEESIQRHLGLDETAARDRVIDLFKKVGIPSPERRVGDYPHEMSGGMRQRVMIAMALACKPRLLIADEPTTALDVTIQAQILELIKELKETENMAVVMITHDLGVIAEVSDHVAVMYAGKVVEDAPVDELFEAPKHPYTRGLLSSIPSPDKLGRRLDVIKGVVPHPLNLPPGCSFAPRCPDRFPDGTCDAAFPALAPISKTHRVACYLYTKEQDEVRAEEPVTIDPNSPIAEEVLGA